MMIAVYGLSIAVIIELCILVPAIYYLMKFSMAILRFQDALEECIDILDERQESISKILKIPLFYDSPEIRRVLDDIKMSRDSIIRVANSFSNIDTEKLELKEDLQRNDFEG